MTEDCRKEWNFKYQNLVFSYLTCVIILLFPPIYAVIEHSFMNYSCTAYIYIYIYIYIYLYVYIYLYIIYMYIKISSCGWNDLRLTRVYLVSLSLYIYMYIWYTTCSLLILFSLTVKFVAAPLNNIFLTNTVQCRINFRL